MVDRCDALDETDGWCLVLDMYWRWYMGSCYVTIIGRLVIGRRTDQIGHFSPITVRCFRKGWAHGRMAPTFGKRQSTLGRLLVEKTVGVLRDWLGLQRVCKWG